jgi:hypothetical protein
MADSIADLKSSRYRTRSHRRLTPRGSGRRTRVNATTPLVEAPIAPAVASYGDGLSRDHCVELDGNRYAIPPALAGQPIELIVDGEALGILHAGRIVAEHVRLSR